MAEDSIPPEPPGIVRLPRSSSSMVKARSAPGKYFFPAVRRDATMREKSLRIGKWPPDLSVRKEG
ncbi:hypothetical protein [Acetobacter aceti]|uniref:hypothetical protein n=1 Tax=Acetobacter aceti TaxID=435 RepID=UPI0011EA55E6|nr:hypothetical protein [Acetobacter aceti]